MDARKVNLAGGKWLKALRERLGLSTRAVQRISKKIADDKQNHEFYLSHNWVTDIENGKFTPGMFKVYSLSTIYDRKYSEVASHFGLHIEDQRRDSASLGFPRTHLLSNAEEDDPEKVSLPIEFKPGFRFEKTNLLARVIEKWDEVPVGLLQHLDLRKSVYGYVGLEDFTLFPIIRPGSLVQIDSTQRKISSLKWKNEYERPDLLYRTSRWVRMQLVRSRSGATARRAASPCPLAGTAVRLPFSGRNHREGDRRDDADRGGKNARAERFIA